MPITAVTAADRLYAQRIGRTIDGWWTTKSAVNSAIRNSWASVANVGGGSVGTDRPGEAREGPAEYAHPATGIAVNWSRPSRGNAYVTANRMPATRLSVPSPEIDDDLFDRDQRREHEQQDERPAEAHDRGDNGDHTGDRQWQYPERVASAVASASASSSTTSIAPARRGPTRSASPRRVTEAVMLPPCVVRRGRDRLVRCCRRPSSLIRAAWAQQDTRNAGASTCLAARVAAATGPSPESVGR